MQARGKESAETGSVPRGQLLPYTTQFPDVILDRWAPGLTEAQLRVVLYIVRRTFGWRKQSDRISLRQFCQGIRRRDGTQLDHGTGLSRPAVIAACEQLVAAGLLQKRVTLHPSGRSGPAWFALNLDCPIETALERLPGPSRRAQKALKRASETPSTTQPRGLSECAGGEKEAGVAECQGWQNAPLEGNTVNPPSSHGVVNPVNPQHPPLYNRQRQQTEGVVAYKARRDPPAPERRVASNSERDPASYAPARMPIARDEQPAPRTAEDEAEWQELRKRFARGKR